MSLREGVEPSSELPHSRNKQLGICMLQLASSIYLSAVRCDHCLLYAYSKCRPSPASHSSWVKSYKDFQKQGTIRYGTGEAKGTWTYINCTKTQLFSFFICTLPRDKLFQCFALFSFCYMQKIICLFSNKIHCS